MEIKKRSAKVSCCELGCLNCKKFIYLVYNKNNDTFEESLDGASNEQMIKIYNAGVGSNEYKDNYIDFKDYFNNNKIIKITILIEENTIKNLKELNSISNFTYLFPSLSGILQFDNIYTLFKNGCPGKIFEKK